MPQFVLPVCGNSGSGKSTFCNALANMMKAKGRHVKIINLDPGNEVMPYTPDISVNDLITVDHVMEDKELNLGPNGALLYAMTYVQENLSWLYDQMENSEDNTFFIMDFPGQMELYTHHEAVKKILYSMMEEANYRVCVILLMDSFCCTDPEMFIGYLLSTLTSMVQLEASQINILSKIDLLPKELAAKMPFNLQYYSEVLDLNMLVNSIEDDPFSNKHKKMIRAVADVIEAYGLVNFIPCVLSEKECLLFILKAIDQTVAYNLGHRDLLVKAWMPGDPGSELARLSAMLNEKFELGIREKRKKKKKEKKSAVTNQAEAHAEVLAEAMAEVQAEAQAEVQAEAQAEVEAQGQA